MLLNSFIRVETLNSTPVDVFHHKDNLNFESFYIIPEYAFAVELNQEKITLSSEHVFFVVIHTKMLIIYLNMIVTRWYYMS